MTTPTNEPEETANTPSPKIWFVSTVKPESKEELEQTIRAHIRLGDELRAKIAALELRAILAERERDELRSRLEQLSELQRHG